MVCIIPLVFPLILKNFNEITHKCILIIGWAMSQPLPVNSFEWINPATISEQDILSWDNNNVKGLILEVCITMIINRLIK